ncbi:hypothetical protein P4O66_012335 [Electrophorus voltai]|uniref:Chemokine interleukin-8-like domain-containing protein n=1 Tax=Electrophorus voltai TaxID=2609070 RepID=A0AAD9DSG8_9TELE|nr:hypothetical protein P4O66_012335 [Electrophorus voltai]
MKFAAALVALACLVIVHVQGHAIDNVTRCLCRGPGLKMVRQQNIVKLEVYPASPYCENVEIIVTLKNVTGQKCLNPESRFAQNYIQRAIQRRSAQ